jgi:hypothetical protein
MTVQHTSSSPSLQFSPLVWDSSDMSDLSRRVSLSFSNETAFLNRSLSAPELPCRPILLRNSLPPILNNVEERCMMVSYKVSQVKAMSICLNKLLEELGEGECKEFLDLLSSRHTKIFFILPALAILKQLEASVGLEELILENGLEWDEVNFHMLPKTLQIIFYEFTRARDALLRLSPKDIALLERVIITNDTSHVSPVKPNDFLGKSTRENNRRLKIRQTYSKVLRITLKMQSLFKQEFQNIIQEGLALHQIKPRCAAYNPQNV